MNQNVIHNTAYSYLSSYKLKHGTFRRLCEWVPNSRVTKEKSSFVVEIAVEKNRGLVKDLDENFLINVIKRTMVQNKKGHHTEVGNLFVKIKVFK